MSVTRLAYSPTRVSRGQNLLRNDPRMKCAKETDNRPKGSFSSYLGTGDVFGSVAASGPPTFHADRVGEDREQRAAPSLFAFSNEVVTSQQVIISLGVTLSRSTLRGASSGGVLKAGNGSGTCERWRTQPRPRAVLGQPRRALRPGPVRPRSKA